MSRPSLATLAGLLFMILYIALAVRVAELAGRMNWAVEALYWCAAGVLWVFPIWWLMLWSVGKR